MRLDNNCVTFLWANITSLYLCDAHASGTTLTVLLLNEQVWLVVVVVVVLVLVVLVVLFVVIVVVVCCLLGTRMVVLERAPVLLCE